MLELLIAVLVLGIMAVLAVPGFARRVPFHRRDAAVARVLSELKAARVMAISEGRRSNVELSGSHHTLTVWLDRDENGTINGTEAAVIGIGRDDNVTITPDRAVGAFTSQGSFVAPSGYWRIALSGRGIPARYVYVLQSGQVMESDELL